MRPSALSVERPCRGRTNKRMGNKATRPRAARVPSHDVHHAVEHAASDLAASVKIPGFRKGKVPRQVLLQRVGKERLMTEAGARHIGGWVWYAAPAAPAR